MLGAFCVSIYSERRAMTPRRASVLLLSCGALLLACAATAALSALPFPQRWARERWEQRRPQHYQLVVLWNDSLGPPHHVRAEMRDRQLVAAVDITTGQPLDLGRLGAERNVLEVDRLFDTIARQSRPSPDWRTQLARYHPLLARWLNPCATRLPDVAYDTEYGYPISVRYHSSTCVDTLAFRMDTSIKVEEFHALP
jgi:hypothetical protein